MDSAWKIACNQVRIKLTELSTVGDSDSYMKLAHRLLSINSPAPVDTTIALELAAQLRTINSDAKLTSGTSLLSVVLCARRCNDLLKTELNTYARRLLRRERLLQATPRETSNSRLLSILVDYARQFAP